ncbi:MAG: TIGR03960 family B12-binding radical SAM protein [Lachnospiraceae bacterium]|nr:TIGR03960 family B12-binding radical SAM protein [Lachnospiraceae bacterium]
MPGNSCVRKEYFPVSIQIPDSLLLSVQKPARYIGGEVNTVTKDLKDVHAHFCFCFPDVYDVGMCHLGLQILYHGLNSYEGVFCERCFAPWTDMEELMRRKDIPLYSLETFTPLHEFDFVGFTLQYEMSYTNILNMLDLGRIPLMAKDRTDEDPLVIAGGPNAYNPEPLADFVDLFYMGEGEVEYEHLFRLYKEHREKGGGRRDFLKIAAAVPGIYVPSLYQVTYEDHPAEGCDHTPMISSVTPSDPAAPAVVTKVLCTDMDAIDYPTRPIIPYLQIVHDRAVMEIFRGCLRGCRFCHAGMVYRPVRMRSKENVLAWVDEVLKGTGYDELSLTSLSSNDYPGLYDLLREIHEKYPHVNVSLPSLRVDAFSLELMEELAQGKKSLLTFAAEGGTQRLRDVINKGITEEEILSGVRLAFEGQWDRIKLYFMLGLPTETQEDVQGIADLASRIVHEWYQVPKEKRSRDVSVGVSTSFFVPKPFTPFQWTEQCGYEEYMEKQHFLNAAIRSKKVRYSCHDAFLSTLEGLLARGDRRTGALIYTAWKKGCRFDSWSDMFNENAWKEAIEETGTEVFYYCYRRRPADEVLPWDHISIGVSKAFLWGEYQRAFEGKVTPNCREHCSGCGIRRICNTGVCTESRTSDEREEVAK